MNTESDSDQRAFRMHRATWCVRACVRARVRACARACVVRECMHACVCVYACTHTQGLNSQKHITDLDGREPGGRGEKTIHTKNSQSVEINPDFGVGGVSSLSILLDATQVAGGWTGLVVGTRGMTTQPGKW